MVDGSLRDSAFTIRRVAGETFASAALRIGASASLQNVTFLFSHFSGVLFETAGATSRCTFVFENIDGEARAATKPLGSSTDDTLIFNSVFSPVPRLFLQLGALRPTIRYHYPRSPAATPPSTLFIDAGVQHLRVLVSDYYLSGALHLIGMYDNSTMEIRDVQCATVFLTQGGRCTLLPCSIDLINVTAFNASAVQRTVYFDGHFQNTWLRLSQIAYFEIYFSPIFTAFNSTVLVERSVLTGIHAYGLRGGNSHDSPFYLRIEKNIFANYSSRHTIIDLLSDILPK